MTSPKPAPNALPSVASPTEASKLADMLLQAMNALLALVEQETQFVRAGRIGEALALEPQKTELSRRYVTAVSLLKGSAGYMKRNTPDLLDGLERHHETFRAMLQVNLTVLATAHAVSEGIIRGVNTELQKRAAPSTYNASGYRTAPSARSGTPLAVSRTL